MNLIEIDWYALPHCPPGQLQKGKHPTDTGYDLMSADTVVVPTYEELDAQGKFIFEEVYDVASLSKESLDLISKQSSSIKISDGKVFRKKYKVPLIRTGVVVKPREVAWTSIVPRSGTPKLNLIMPNSVGVIDYTYSKMEKDKADELMIQLIAVYEPTVVFRGERIAQLIPQYYVRNQLSPSNDDSIFSGIARGGFNSSGSF